MYFMGTYGAFWAYFPYVLICFPGKTYIMFSKAARVSRRDLEYVRRWNETVNRGARKEEGTHMGRLLVRVSLIVTSGKMVYLSLPKKITHDESVWIGRHKGLVHR